MFHQKIIEWTLPGTLGLPPTLNKFVAEDENQLLVWNFLTRAVFSPESANPRRRIDAPLREGLDDVIREVQIIYQPRLNLYYLEV